MGRKPNFDGMSIGNMQSLVKQARKMQQQVGAKQANLVIQELVGESADDMIVATFSDDHQLKDLRIDKEAADPDDPDMLQDLVIDTINKGIKAVDDVTQASMGEYTKGLM